jgi:hypothetical protein
MNHPTNIKRAADSIRAAMAQIGGEHADECDVFAMVGRLRDVPELDDSCSCGYGTLRAALRALAIDPDQETAAVAPVIIQVSGGNVNDIRNAGDYILVDWDNIREGDRLTSEELARLPPDIKTEYDEATKPA